MKVVDLPPFAPMLIESTRAIGYSLETAVADIIDNSIAAMAGYVWVSFIPIDDAYIAILDDGHGMSDSSITNAMKYGSTSPLDERSKSDLGRFGLGLKTASFSQCRCLTVISKQCDSIVARRWDIDYVRKTGQWSLIELEADELQGLPQIDKLQKLAHGTLILWQNLDRIKMGEVNFQQSMSQKMGEVRQHLSFVYHRYLSGEVGIKRLTIEINNEPVIPADPFLQKKSYQAMDDDILIIHGEKVLIRPYILPHLSKLTSAEIASLGGKEGLRRQQGFYIYRNKRLLAWGTWFRMMRQGDLSKLARIQVDLPNSLDDLWTLDIKKSIAIPPAELRQNLVAVIQRIAEKSKQTWVYRGKKETSDTSIHVWNRVKLRGGEVLYEINREHPFIAGLMSQSESKKSIEVMLHHIELELPINQLYVDLNNDTSISNEAEYEKKDVRKMFDQVLSTCRTNEERATISRDLRFVDPFCNYPDLFDK